MSKLEEKFATIGIKEYIEEYRNAEHFLTFCKECNGYGKTWACPPFEQPIDLSPYNYANIFGTKIFVDQELTLKETTPAEISRISRQILSDTRHSLDEKLLILEKQNPYSRALFAGSCKSCKEGECTRPQGKACAKPERCRPSLESLGFDVGKTTSELLEIELKWGATTLPEYFTLVYALFTKEPIILDK